MNHRTFKYLISFGLLFGVTGIFHAQNSLIDIIVEKIPIGKKKENIFASEYHDGKLFFCSNAKSNSDPNFENENNYRFLDLYSSPYNPNSNKAGEVKNLGSLINSRLNEGPIFISPSSGISFFSSNLNNSGQESLLNIFRTKYLGGSECFEQKKCEFPDATNSMSNPCITDDGKYLIFTSDVGKSIDILYSKREGNSWSDAKKIEGLNTDSTESFPRLEGNKLYFASNRKGSYGGLDIFYCYFDEGACSEIKHLTNPINSEYDDFLYFVTDTKHAIFSSNRENGIDKPFLVTYNRPVPQNFKTIDENFCFELFDEFKIEDDSYFYQWNLGDGTIKTGPIVNHCYKDTGVFSVKCDLVNKNTKEVEESIMEGEITISINLPIIEIIEKENNVTISMSEKYNKFKFDQFYWIIDDKIFLERKVNLTKKDNLSIKLVIWKENSPDKVVGITKSLTLN